MVYTEAVIKEALRNATPFSDRARGITVFILQRAVKTFELGGYRVPEVRSSRDLGLSAEGGDH